MWILCQTLTGVRHNIISNIKITSGDQSVLHGVIDVLYHNTQQLIRVLCTHGADGCVSPTLSQTFLCHTVLANGFPFGLVLHGSLTNLFDNKSTDFKKYQSGLFNSRQRC
jgi:hypothetical protein